MEAHKHGTPKQGSQPGFSLFTNHEQSVAVEGLEDLFKWASDMVSDGEDARVKRAREQRIRRQVMEAVQKLREQQAIMRATDENAYLQRRLIACLQKLQEYTEEKATLTQIMVAQSFTIQRIPVLEDEIKQLKTVSFDREAAQVEQRVLLNALSKLKADRDFLDDLVRINEEENARLAQLLAEARQEIDQLKSRRWWHALLFWKKSS